MASDFELIHPARTEGKQRLFSFNDVDTLLEIKSLIEKGLNIAGIKQVMDMKSAEVEKTEITEKSEAKRKEMSEKELRQMLKQQIMNPGASRLGETALIRGELSRFFH